MLLLFKVGGVSALLAVVVLLVEYRRWLLRPALWFQRQDRYGIPTFGDVLIWSEDLSTSTSQIQKLYDWRISQWTGLGTAVLTATLGFISAAIIEIIKDPKIYNRLLVSVVGLGVAISVAIYGLCQRRVVSLRREFMAFYALLARLH